MRFKALWGVINAIILVVVSYGTFSYLVGVYSVEIDEVSVATYVVDGDTFDVAMGERVRLADVDTPERGQAGYSEASYFLEQLIYGERVYLDVDDVYRYGPYGRLICLVYVDYNSTHYVNVNEALCWWGTMPGSAIMITSSAPMGGPFSFPRLDLRVSGGCC